MANNRWSKSKISKSLEPDEKDKIAKMKAMDELELRKVVREARKMKQVKIKDVVTEKQTKVKEILEKENASSKSNLKFTKDARRCLQDTKQAQDIANLFAQGDDLDDAISLEKKYIQDLESEIQKETINIQRLNKRRGKTIINSDYLMDKEKERADRTLESYKSKLTTESKQLAIAVKENEEMRKKLDHLLKEKAQFNQVYEQLMGKLTHTKSILQSIVEQSRLKFQKRDEVARKIEALKSRDKEDYAKRMDEMQNLEIKYYEDTKLANFRNRIQLIRETLDESTRPKNESMEQERLMVVVERAQELLNKLMEVTGVEKPEDICDYINKQEADLFCLFNFNNEVRDQLEVVMHENVEKVKIANEEISAAEETEDEFIRHKEIMKRKLNALEQEQSDLIDLLDDNGRVFSRLLDRIKTLFDTTDCNSSSLQDLLGSNGEATEFNYKLYLGLIETKVIEALDLVQPTTQLPTTNRSRTLASPSLRTKSSKSSKSTKSSKLSKGDGRLPKIASRRIVTKPCGECERVPMLGYQ